MRRPKPYRKSRRYRKVLKARRHRLLKLSELMTRAARAYMPALVDRMFAPDPFMAYLKSRTQPKEALWPKEAL